MSKQAPPQVPMQKPQPPHNTTRREGELPPTDGLDVLSAETLVHTAALRFLRMTPISWVWVGFCLFWGWLIGSFVLGCILLFLWVAGLGAVLF